MANIYEIKNEFLTLWSILEDELTDDETLAGAFETATEDLKDKLDNCCKYIKNEQATVKGLDEEIKRLQAKKKAKENAIDRLKKLMKDAMDTAGEKKLPCGTFLVYIQNNPTSVKIDEQYIENIPEEYFKPRKPEDIDKTKLKADLEAGKDLGGIAHLEQTQSLRMK